MSDWVLNSDWLNNLISLFTYPLTIQVFWRPAAQGGNHASRALLGQIDTSAYSESTMSLQQ